MFKRKLFLSFMLFLISSIPFASHAQSNSCVDYYKKRNMTLHYSYNDSTQVHDYSNNWDLNNDGIKDQVYFIGTQGAHLYFYLRVLLSPGNKPNNFSSIELDFPCLGDSSDIDQLKTPNSFPKFMVHDFDSDGVLDIYVNVNSSSDMAKSWKTTQLLITFKNQKIIIRNYIP